MKELIKSFISFITSRVFILAVIITCMFCFMIFNLFNLQIVEGEKHLKNLQAYILRNLSIPAPRGTIYDRYSRPLAINNVAYSVKIDSSILDNNMPANILNAYKNSMYMDLIRKIEENGDTLIDDLPISTTRPYTFLFNGDVEKEVDWKINTIGYSNDEVKTYLKNEETKKTYKEEINEIVGAVTAEQIMEYLRDDLFGISNKLDDDELKKLGEYSKDIDISTINSNLSDEDVRKLVSLRYSLYLQRWRQYQPVTIALDVSDKTVAVIEENNDKYKGVNIETESLREYPEKGLFSHILGYTRAIDNTEYEEYKKYVYKTDKKTGEIKIEKQEITSSSDDLVYTRNDIIGKTGLERSMELELNGIDGEMSVAVDVNGRRIDTVDTTKKAIPGKNIFLSIDRDLQEVAYKTLIERLKETILLRLSPVSSLDKLVTIKDVFVSIVKINNLFLDSVLKSTEGSFEYRAKQILIDNDAAKAETSDDIKYAKQVLSNAIETGELSSKQMILILHEQGRISGDDNFVTSVSNGSISPITVIKDKIKSDELTPQDLGVNPYSGAVVVTDIKTGKVLAMVGYPTYDNNELVNNFNYNYYSKLLNDQTTPLTNRPLYTRKAPGSTFKMVSALAGLETGLITPTTTIYDQGQFEKTGKPYPKCWLYGQRGRTHGAINVKKALEVSCNYFFYDMSYRLGIETLNKYIDAFGLSDRTGVEIGETDPIAANPENKKKIAEQQGSNEKTWSGGDTIRAAIGQSCNSYTPANMAKYIATLANGGTRYKMSLINGIENPDGNFLYKESEVEQQLELQEENLQAVYEGMHNVTRGVNGTLTTKFKDYPIEVAAKTGTAQEATPDHTWFVGFAPYENPQIAIAVMIPYGDASNTPAAEVAMDIIAYYMGLDSETETKTMSNILSK